MNDQSDGDSDREKLLTHLQDLGMSSTLQAIGEFPTSRRPQKTPALSLAHPEPPLTPICSTMPPLIANILPPSAPASPPTPAPSPAPHLRSPPIAGRLTPLDDVGDSVLGDARQTFARLSPSAKEAWLRSMVDLCDNHLLSFLHQIVSPRLKKDPFKALPNEICFRVLEFIDEPKTFVRASQVSRRWREIVSDDQAWKTLCEKHAYRRMSTDSNGSVFNKDTTSTSQGVPEALRRSPSADLDESDSAEVASTASPRFKPAKGSQPRSSSRKTGPRHSHRSRFKHAYLVESAWRKGGTMIPGHIMPDQGVVTSLHLTKKFIVIALDNAKIHIFDVKGCHLRTLSGHVMGVWAMVPWDDILVSGGCDRDVRVWNMTTGTSVHVLRGHSSTVRCLKMSDSTTAISGSRDTTLRIWNIETGRCLNILTGHQASVRCLEIHGDLVVSGSYDTTAKIWRISTGECVRTLQGHFSQIYAIAFDGNRVATGSLDTSVRIWNPHDGQCVAILQGHTSLVGQLQMRHSTLVTGGSDGSVRVWSLDTHLPIHRLAAHDNSVTSLQFDESRIVSGGSDGRVKIWDTHTGAQVRELSQPAEAVWRLAFESERCVVLASRGGRTVMEVWDFAPQDAEGTEGFDDDTEREDSPDRASPVLRSPDEAHDPIEASSRARNVAFEQIRHIRQAGAGIAQQTPVFGTQPISTRQATMVPTGRDCQPEVRSVTARRHDEPAVLSHGSLDLEMVDVESDLDTDKGRISDNPRLSAGHVSDTLGEHIEIRHKNDDAFMLEDDASLGEDDEDIVLSTSEAWDSPERRHEDRFGVFEADQSEERKALKGEPSLGSP